MANYREMKNHRGVSYRYEDNLIRCYARRNDKITLNARTSVEKIRKRAADVPADVPAESLTDIFDEDPASVG